MTVTLTKQITLKNVEIYLKLEKKVKREDIQKYLQGKHFDNSIVENRVREYLKGNKIFDDQYHLTPSYGNEVKETGMVNVLEEGKYLIWITQKDTLFGNKIFFLKRQKPDYPKNDIFDEINIDEKKHFCLSSNKNDFFLFNLKNSNINKYNGIKLQNDALLTFSWKWKDLASSVYTFEGKIDNNGIDKNIEIDSDEDLNKKIIEIIPDWDSEYNRCRMPFKAISNKKECISRFQCNYRNKWEDFDVNINNLPVEPCDKDEAKVWRNAIFNMEIEEKYMHPDDFTGNIISINQKEGFSAYSAQLDDDIPDINEHISKLDPAKKSDRGADYWHLAAPMDLNIGIPQRLKTSDHFSLEKGESIRFSELVSKFGKFTADKVFYYDKYVTNYYQQRSVAAFLNSFGIPDICIITDRTQQNFSNYLVQNKPAIAVEDIGSVYQQNRRDAPHDRFIIFKHGDDVTVWTSTNSIDYIRFNVSGEIQPNDSGTIFQSVTFTRVDKNILGLQLEDFIL